MNSRPAEIGHHAIAEQLRDVSAHLSNCIGCSPMIAVLDQPQLLGIEAMRNLSRSYDVAEQNAPAAFD